MGRQKHLKRYYRNPSFFDSSEYLDVNEKTGDVYLPKTRSDFYDKDSDVLIGKGRGYNVIETMANSIFIDSDKDTEIRAPGKAIFEEGSYEGLAETFYNARNDLRARKAKRDVEFL